MLPFSLNLTELATGLVQLGGRGVAVGYPAGQGQGFCNACGPERPTGARTQPTGRGPPRLRESCGASAVRLRPLKKGDF